MTISVLFLVGRFVFVVPFVLGGVDRLLADDERPVAKSWAALGLVGAAGVALGAWGDLAALVVAVAILGAGIADGAADGDRRLPQVGLLGAALCVAALSLAVGSALDFTLTDPVLDLDLR
jgi:hypothetical protein